MTTPIKSYHEIVEESGLQEAQRICDNDGDYLDENLPQVTRSFQVVHDRINHTEDLLNSMKITLAELNATLESLKSSVLGVMNETRH